MSVPSSEDARARHGFGVGLGFAFRFRTLGGLARAPAPAHPRGLRLHGSGLVGPPGPA